MKLIHGIYIFFFLVITSSSISAQNEVIREVSSLSGISGFGIVVNVEKPGSISSRDLSPAVIREKIHNSLSELDVTILSDEELRESELNPLLHIHVNIMKASNNTYPYSVELNFYQPVKLPLKDDLLTTGATWNNSMVGLVSENYFNYIAEECVYTASLFKQAFKEANR